jgi:crotonobetainyl-CoA:carnitine CoA-transferase CaiB-like acyl-CoA transferase
MNKNMAPPITGTRVLDLSRVLAGPWATQTLADMGADVIKIERPGYGDETRSYAPFIASDGGASTRSTYFLAATRGKRSVAIDLTNEQGQELVREIADRSDILVENHKVGSLAKLGLDYKTLSARNPGLIYCSITGFGQTGPYRDRLAYDLVVQAMGGMMSLTGEPDGEPMKSGIAMVDITTSLYATTAILGALHERERSKRGQYIDLGLFDVQIATLANQAASYLMTDHVPERYGNAHVSIVPYGAFSSSDGRMIIAVANDSQFQRFGVALGLPELGTDPRFQTNEARVRNRKQLIPMIEERLRARSTREWVTVLDREHIPTGPINALDAVFDDPQIAARDLLVEFRSGGDDRVRVVGNPIKFSRTPISQAIAPPFLGAHTDELLSELLGKSQDTIRGLHEAGVIE